MKFIHHKKRCCCDKDAEVITPKVDTSEVDETIEKVRRLNELLKETNALIGEISSKKVDIVISL